MYMPINPAAAPMRITGSGWYAPSKPTIIMPNVAMILTHTFRMTRERTAASTSGMISAII